MLFLKYRLKYSNLSLKKNKFEFTKTFVIHVNYFPKVVFFLNYKNYLKILF